MKVLLIVTTYQAIEKQFQKDIVQSLIVNILFWFGGGQRKDKLSDEKIVFSMIFNDKEKLIILILSDYKIACKNRRQSN